VSARFSDAPFLEFFYLLRAQGVPVSVREWLTLLECLAGGLVGADLSRLYAVARAVLIKRERHLDTYDQCFAYYFGGAEPPAGLPSALDQWLSAPLPLPELDADTLARLERLNLEDLRRRFEERLQEQTERHDGGSKWVGTGGTSPFGHSGRHPSGIRVGGEGRSRSAVQVAAERRFAPYRADLTLDTRQLSAALRRLRSLGRDGRADELDLDATVHATARQCGELEVRLRPPRENRLKLVLLMDVGGSMDEFAQLVGRLLSAAHRAHHFRAFHPLYFHNCVYESVFRDAALRDPLPLSTLQRDLGLDAEARLLVLGDAYMSPYELMSVGGAIDYRHHNLKTGLEHMRDLRAAFPWAAWLNPMPRRYWEHPTIDALGELFPMFELTLEGLEGAVSALTRHTASPRT
jgi:uncharacterized protein with von Willebrand factor type A (vWA) domain